MRDLPTIQRGATFVVDTGGSRETYSGETRTIGTRPPQVFWRNPDSPELFALTAGDIADIFAMALQSVAADGSEGGDWRKDAAKDMLSYADSIRWSSEDIDE